MILFHHALIPLLDKNNVMSIKSSPGLNIGRNQNHTGLPGSSVWRIVHKEPLARGSNFTAWRFFIKNKFFHWLQENGQNVYLLMSNIFKTVCSTVLSETAIYISINIILHFNSFIIAHLLILFCLKTFNVIRTILHTHINKYQKRPQPCCTTLITLAFSILCSYKSPITSVRLLDLSTEKARSSTVRPPST